MASIQPFRGTRYNAEHVKLGGVLAPPYDVITDVRRDELYGRDMRNIVRIDYGLRYPDDVAGMQDAYTRAAAFLNSWLELGVLVRDDQPGYYVVDHLFQHPDGGERMRRGLLATVAATSWEQSDLRPHERTMSGPKLDRLALMRATRAQTSPVFAIWQDGNHIDEVLAGLVSEHALLGGRIDGEIGSEKLLVWRISEPAQVTAITESFRDAALYIADGHHRYETAAAYATERRGAQPDAPRDASFERCLVYLAAADDPGITILPTHRLVRPGPGIAFSLDDLWARLDDAYEAEAVDDVSAALAIAVSLHDTHHAFAVVAHDGVAVLRRPRGAGGSPRDRLDAAVLESEVLRPAGVTADAIVAGALAYTREAGALEKAVRSGDAVLGFGVTPVSTGEVIAVADAGETMPQKSTYFYPKVPTGLVVLEV
jgi:uncharacterized protein (DUF1015 family)